MHSARQKFYTIGEAAKFLGVSSETLRRWDRQGKIRIGRTPAGYRVFNEQELELLKQSFQPQESFDNKPYTTLHNPQIKFPKISFSKVSFPKIGYKTLIVCFLILIFIASNAVTVYTLTNFTPLPGILSREASAKYRVLSENVTVGRQLVSSFAAQEYEKLSFLVLSEYKKLAQSKYETLKQDEEKILEVAKIPDVSKTVLAEQSSNSDLILSGIALYSPTNQIINSSFEAGITGYSIIAQSTNDNTKVGNESIRSGTQALKFNDPACQFASSFCQLGISQPKVNTINGRSYSFSVYVRVKDLKGTPALRIGLFGTVSTSDPLYLSQPSNYQSYAQDRYDDFNLSTLRSNEWIRLSSTFETLPLGKYPIIEVINYQGGTVYIDDVSLNEVPNEIQLGSSDSFSAFGNSSLFPQEQNNIKLADNAIIADSFGNLYPNSPFSGSIGIDGTRFASLYLTKFTVDSGGNVVTSGNIQAKDITLTGASTFTSISGTSINVTGNINTSGGSLQTNGVTRIDNSGNLTAGTGAFSGTVTVGGGTGKIDVGTVDPPYTIGGTKFATYLSSITGVKEETSGTIVLDQNGKYEIEFSKVPKGSDLWLFYQTTDLGKNWENLTILLTPGFEGKVWYVKDPKSNKITIFGNSAREVSYRLTAPRFDHLNWPNIRVGGSEGFVLEEKK